MNNVNLLLLSAGLYVFSIFFLRYIGKTVPLVLLGLPVILAGLGAIGAFALLSALSLPAALCGAASLAAAALSGYWGYKMANDTFTDAIFK